MPRTAQQIYEYKKQWSEKNKEKITSLKKQYYNLKKKEILQNQRKRYLENRDEISLRSKKCKLRSKYFPHLSIDKAWDTYQQLLHNQGGVCAICHQPEVKIDKQRGTLCILAVDHCHTTGTVRGLLCFRCNTNLGWFETMSDKFSNYLKKVAL
jgi:hypothetical protein